MFPTCSGVDTQSIVDIKQYALKDSDSECGSTTSSNSVNLGENSPNYTMRRRLKQNWCLIGLCFAFSLGLTIGILAPFIYIPNEVIINSSISVNVSANQIKNNNSLNSYQAPLPLYSNSHFPTIRDVQTKDSEEIFKKAEPKSYHSVSFVPELVNYDPRKLLDNAIDVKYTPDRLLIEKTIDSQSRHFEILRDGTVNEKHDSQNIFKNVFNIKTEEDNTMLLKKLDPKDGHIKEFKVQLTEDGLYRKSKEVQLSKPSLFETNVEFKAPKELMIDNGMEHSDTIISNNIYWGSKVEQALPQGYGKASIEIWSDFIDVNTAVKLEPGCGRMQNRLVTFENGQQACVRYRQNTDQIQGELFSFYLGQILNLTNLAPSVISVVDLQNELWAKIGSEIASAQWNSYRPVVMTKFIPNLEPANIPNEFKPLERHLNKYDVGNITTERDHDSTENILMEKLTENMRKSVTINREQSRNSTKFDRNGNLVGKVSSTVISRLVELAQWSDLIVFDYLTANLDRIVNNLYNYQWNANIMDAPAHNLARKIDNNLLVFLDNESGLLHGYRLLRKYEVYHTLLLDNLCVFRKSTASVIKRLKQDGDIGNILNNMFDKYNSKVVKDVLPNLPDKSIKILNERIDRVYNQIKKCEGLFSTR